MKIFKKFVEIIKKKGVLFDITPPSNNSINISFMSGTYSGHLQFEKLEDEEDYTSLQTWINTENSNEGDEDSHEYFEDISEYEDGDIEEIIDNIIQRSNILNTSLMQIKSKFDEGIKLGIELEISINLVSNIFYESLNQMEN